MEGSRADRRSGLSAAHLNRRPFELGHGEDCLTDGAERFSRGSLVLPARVAQERYLISLGQTLDQVEDTNVESPHQRKWQGRSEHEDPHSLRRAHACALVTRRFLAIAEYSSRISRTAMTRSRSANAEKAK